MQTPAEFYQFLYHRGCDQITDSILEQLVLAHFLIFRTQNQNTAKVLMLLDQGIIPVMHLPMPAWGANNGRNPVSGINKGDLRKGMSILWYWGDISGQ